MWLLCIIHTLTQYHQSQSFSHCFNFCLSSSLLTPWATSFKNLPLSFRCSKILELALYTNSGNSTGSGDRTKSVAAKCAIHAQLPCQRHTLKKDFSTFIWNHVLKKKKIILFSKTDLCTTGLSHLLLILRGQKYFHYLRSFFVAVSATAARLWYRHILQAAAQR